MNYDQAVVDFLILPENLPTVLEVARRAEEVKNHLQIQFWQYYRDEMQRRLQVMGSSARWEIQLYAPQRLLGDWANCRIAYRSPGKQVLHLDIVLESGQRQAKYPIYYGLRWSLEVREPPGLAALTELVRAVDQLALAGVPSPPWWIYYVKLDQHIRDDDFLIRFATEPAGVVTEVCDAVCNLFEHIRTHLETLNEQLRAL